MGQEREDRAVETETCHIDDSKNCCHTHTREEKTFFNHQYKQVGNVSK